MANYSPQQVCDLLGISKSTLLLWELKNKIAKSKKIAGNRVYSVDDIERIIGELSALQKQKARRALKTKNKQLKTDRAVLIRLLNSLD